MNTKLLHLPDDQLKRLSEIAREHSRLAAEFGRPDTTADRKEQIWQRIEELRKERTAILEGGEKFEIEQVLAHLTVSVSDRLNEIAAERNIYLEALDRIVEEYSKIASDVRGIIYTALTDRCPRCRYHRPLYKVRYPYIRRIYGRLCQPCLNEEALHYD